MKIPFLVEQVQNVNFSIPVQMSCAGGGGGSGQSSGSFGFAPSSGSGTKVVFIGVIKAQPSCRLGNPGSASSMSDLSTLLRR